jgi:hypothetical protein
MATDETRTKSEQIERQGLYCNEFVFLIDVDVTLVCF